MQCMLMNVILKLEDNYMHRINLPRDIQYFLLFFINITCLVQYRNRNRTILYVFYLQNITLARTHFTYVLNFCTYGTSRDSEGD